MSVIIRPGSILPLLTSALGLVCAAYLPPDLTKDVSRRKSPNIKDQVGLRREKRSRGCKAIRLMFARVVSVWSEET